MACPPPRSGASEGGGTENRASEHLALPPSSARAFLRIKQQWAEAVTATTVKGRVRLFESATEITAGG